MEGILGDCREDCQMNLLCLKDVPLNGCCIKINGCTFY